MKRVEPKGRINVKSAGVLVAFRIVLLNEYGNIGTDVAKLTSSPYYFVRGGIVWQASDLFASAGNVGLYWSSTPLSSASDAYYLYFDSTSGINPSSNSVRQYGFSVRCLAR